MKSGSRRATRSLWSTKRRRRAADVHGDARCRRSRAARRRRAGAATSAVVVCDPAASCVGDDGDDRGVARRGCGRGGETEATSRSARAARTSGSSALRPPGPVGQLGDEQQRAVGAGPEALDGQVVGRAGHACRPGRCPRRGSRGADRGRARRAPAATAAPAMAAVHGPALDGAAPARRGRSPAPSVVRRAPEARERSRFDAPARRSRAAPAAASPTRAITTSTARRGRRARRPA